jgi:hypothetical protein
MSVQTPCKGGGKNWSVNKDGKPICPGCYRGFATIAGYGKTPRNTPTVPPHARPGKLEGKKPRPDQRAG